MIKELEGRRLLLGDVGSRPSFMNSNPAMPDDKDRAYTHLILINQDGRFDTDQETYSLENITSIEPGMRSNEGQNTTTYKKEKPLPSVKYTFVPSTKPHNKTHFNNKKFTEQENYLRERQIKKTIEF